MHLQESVSNEVEAKKTAFEENKVLQSELQTGEHALLSSSSDKSIVALHFAWCNGEDVRDAQEAKVQPVL